MGIFRHNPKPEVTTLDLSANQLFGFENNPSEDVFGSKYKSPVVIWSMIKLGQLDSANPNFFPAVHVQRVGDGMYRLDSRHEDKIVKDGLVSKYDGGHHRALAFYVMDKLLRVQIAPDIGELEPGDMPIGLSEISVIETDAQRHKRLQKNAQIAESGIAGGSEPYVLLPDELQVAFMRDRLQANRIRDGLVSV